MPYPENFSERAAGLAPTRAALARESAYASFDAAFTRLGRAFTAFENAYGRIEDAGCDDSTDADDLERLTAEAEALTSGIECAIRVHGMPEVAA
jgi:hypothetical protein